MRKLWMANDTRVALSIIMLIVAMTVSVSLGQGNTLTPGVPATGTLDATNVARIFTFDGTSDATISLNAVSGNGQSLGIVLTTAQGVSVGQALDRDNAGFVSLTEVLLPETGTYFVTIFAAGGPTAEPDTFVLTLTSSDELLTDLNTPAPETTAEVEETPALESTPEPAEVLLNGGLQVRLSWAGTSDLNLQVRDPQGETLFWDSRTTTNGGTFGFDANGFCEPAAIVTNPTETASWIPGFLPTGSYEVLVYYRQACDTATPVTFTLDILVNGISVDQFEGTLAPPLPNQESVHIARFELRGDGSADVSRGGVYAGVNALPAPIADVIANPQPIQRNVPVQGEISNETNYVTYSFAGTGGELVTIDMRATSPALDTLLLLLDANGNLVAANDDIEFGITNSSIVNWRLPVDGVYYVVASRYGKQIGGTEGTFELVVSGPTADLPSALLALNLPDGDIEISLVWNTDADLQLLVRDPVGDSVFDDSRFVNSGGILGADGNVGCRPSESDQPVSYVYWPRGFLRPGSYEIEVWFQNDCLDTRPVEFTLTGIVGDEVIFVERQRPLPGQRYVKSFIVNPDGTSTANLGGFVGGSETLDYLAERDNAIPVVSGQPVFGNLSAINTFDVYSFEGQIGDVVTISMESSGSALDTKLFLISPSGIEIAENDDAVPSETTNSLISDVTLTEDGTYLIIATRFATIYGGTVGGYSLTFRSN